MASDVAKKNEIPLATTLHFVEGFALVLLCNYRPYLRKLAAMILKEVKNLMRALGIPETEPPLIDVMDRCVPAIVEKCLPMLPQTEKTAILNANCIDLQWIAERSSGVWLAGLTDGGESFFNLSVHLFIEKSNKLSSLQTTQSPPPRRSTCHSQVQRQMPRPRWPAHNLHLIRGPLACLDCWKGSASCSSVHQQWHRPGRFVSLA